MKRKLNLPESQTLLYYFIKLTGLGLFTVKNNKFLPPTLLTQLYSVALAVGHLTITILAWNLDWSKITDGNYSQMEKLVDRIGHFMSLPGTTLALIILVLLHKKITDLMIKLSIISAELKSLGIDDKHGKLFKNGFLTAIIAYAGIIAMCVTIGLTESHWPIITSLKDGIDNWFEFHIFFVFAQILLYIRQRFTLVNRSLYDVFNPARQAGSIGDFPIFMVSRIPREQNTVANEGLTDVQRIRKICALHLALCDSVERTTHLFATSILFISLRIFCILTGGIYWIYTVVLNSSQLEGATGINRFEITDICSPILRMVIVTVNLFVIAHASVTVCEQGNATNAVLYKVWYTFKLKKLKREFLLFSAQLLHTPVTVSAFGFFSLDYSYIFQMFCGVLAYSIIVIQLDISR